MSINSYRKNIPFSERIIKDIFYLFNATTNYFKNGFQTRNVLFYPEYPSKRTIIFKLLKRLNYNITNNLNAKAALIINWENVTIRNRYPELEKRAGTNKIINNKCLNISKIHIDKVHKEVFGYCTIVDPAKFEGMCVKKSDANAKHDGKVIQCPIPVSEIDPNYIYQLIINNEAEDTMVYDLRVPVLHKHIPFLYIKYRPHDDRFSNTNTKTELVEDIYTRFSKEEVVQIKEFCDAVGLEYGELDILRNKDDGKIYIIDVNYTPWGPPNHLGKKSQLLAVSKLAEAFNNQFLMNN